ncbi:DDE-type integrase/transposase/recombinase [Pseudomonas sp. JDS08PS003]|uniref:Mu transposase C-terminal domain-containing protein n=1 Tax=Pseudomonas sp. JDS08PS003 TaxID=2497162 RepID=UPI003857D729
MQQISIAPGILVLAGNKQLEIIAPVSSNKIQARDLVTGEAVLISPGEIECELKRTPTVVDREAATEKEPPDIGDVKEADLQLASERFSVLSSMAGNKVLSKQDVAQCTAALGLSASQVRRLFARLDLNVGPLSLLQQRRGRTKGVKLIAAATEDIIQETIDEYYAGPGATHQRVIEKITERCLASSIPAPSAATIASRIRERKPRALLAKKSGSKAARQAYEVRGGKIQPEAPLELIQIDHALVDCIIVDSERRLPLTRPWVTIAIDVYTRVVLGFYLSLSYPSAMSVALCIAHSILPKERWLKTYGFTGGEYPFYGVPKRIHVDNAREFRSKNLSDSCRWYGIELTFRPKGTPHNGAHIERLIGTLMGKVHVLPGTTMSSAKDKGHYKSDQHATLSFPEFREWFIREVEIYHKTTHSALGCSPLLQWENHYLNKDGGFASPPIIDDQLRLLIDFMPIKKRVIGRAGVRLHNIDYYSSTLKRFDIGTKCTVRYDPESLSKVWVLPTGERTYIELGYADLRLPNTTLTEFKRLRAQLKDESERRVPAAEVFNLIEKNETLVNAAGVKSKQARKMRERKKTRFTDPGHPLNEKIAVPDHPASTDYSLKPKAYEIEE